MLLWPLAQIRTFQQQKTPTATATNETKKANQFIYAENIFLLNDDYCVLSFISVQCVSVCMINDIWTQYKTIKHLWIYGGDSDHDGVSRMDTNNFEFYTHWNAIQNVINNNWPTAMIRLLNERRSTTYIAESACVIQ